MEMADMKRLLDVKGRTLLSIQADAKAVDALRLMGRQKVGFLVVLEGERMVGVFSERDVIRLLTDSDTFLLEQPMREVMTTPVYTVRLDTSVDHCLALMSENGIRHVPVMEPKTQKVVGVVSIRDVAREVVADREATIKGMENYIISGDYVF
jgi:CBS domain-containing protein